MRARPGRQGLRERIEPGEFDPTSPPNAPPRESLEVRMLVFYPPNA